MIGCESLVNYYSGNIYLKYVTRQTAFNLYINLLKQLVIMVKYKKGKLIISHETSNPGEELFTKQKSMISMVKASQDQGGDDMVTNDGLEILESLLLDSDQIDKALKSE